MCTIARTHVSYAVCTISFHGHCVLNKVYSIFLNVRMTESQERRLEGPMLEHVAHTGSRLGDSDEIRIDLRSDVASKTKTRFSRGKSSRRVLL